MNQLKKFLEGHEALCWETNPTVSISLLRNRDCRPLQFNEELDEVRFVMRELTRMTASSFGLELDESKDEGTRQHIQNVDILAIAHSEDSPVGFASGFFPREGLFYLHGVAVSPQVKGKGVARSLMESFVEVSKLPNIAFTTQNPIMYCLVRALYQRIYPSIDARIVPRHVQEMTTRIMDKRSGTFDPESGVASNLYSTCLYGKLPASSDEEVNQWFADGLQAVDGATNHAFCFVGEEFR